MVQILNGFDLFALLPETGPYIVAHGVNDVGAWGRGFTADLNEALPWARRDYRRWHEQGHSWPDPPGPLRLGATFVAHAPDNPTRAVAHLCVQRGLRHADAPTPFRLDALRSALAALTPQLHHYPGSAVYMPAIGTGLGGYPDADAVVAAVEEWAATHDRTVFFFKMDRAARIMRRMEW